VILCLVKIILAAVMSNYYTDYFHSLTYSYSNIFVRDTVIVTKSVLC